MKITNTTELKTAIRNGKYVWPGGYNTYFIAQDCEPLCHDCVRDNFRLVLQEMRHPSWHDQWRVVGIDINFEDAHLHCINCNEHIEAAYGEE